MLRLVIAGVGGRMGREVAAAAAADPAFAVVGGTVRPGSAAAEQAWEVVTGMPLAGARIVADPRAIVPEADVVVDFSTPAATLAHAEVCAGAGVPLVSGTTGFDFAQTARLRTCGERTALFLARNMSAGIGALLALLPTLAEALAGYDVEIVETHHRHKQDAPSGTALMLAEAIAGGAAPLVHGREGMAPRRAGEIGVHAIRAGGNPGEHVVVFACEGEEVRVGHRAFGRRAYAEGALRAARWLVGQPPGVYGPADLQRPSGQTSRPNSMP